MKRIIKSATTFAIASLLALAVSSCDGIDVKTIVGSGNVKTETRKIDGTFDHIKAERGLDVVVVQSDVTSVVVEADDNLLKGITTKLEGNTLVISSEYNSYSNVSSKKVTFKMPKITGIDAESGSIVKSEGNLRSERLALTTSSGANMNVVTEADKLSAEASSGSVLEVAGKALDFQTDSSSGSSVVAGELLANDVVADASSGSNILVHPLVKLSGNASSGGSIKYDGDPKSFTKDESSGGSVSKK